MEYVILYSIQGISMRKGVSQIEKDIVEQELTWSEPLRVDKTLSNVNSWRKSHE